MNPSWDDQETFNLVVDLTNEVKRLRDENALLRAAYEKLLKEVPRLEVPIQVPAAKFEFKWRRN